MVSSWPDKMSEGAAVEPLLAPRNGGTCVDVQGGKEILTNYKGMLLSPTMDQVLASEFPFVEALPKREKSRFRKALDMFNEYSALTQQHGALVPPAFVGKVLDVSHQRVLQICDDGRLKRVEFYGHVYITRDSVIEFASLERKAGRPVKGASMDLKDCWNASKEILSPKKK
jgi:hypothetical protein